MLQKGIWTAAGKHAGHHRPPTALWGLVAAALVTATLLLAGCSGGEGDIEATVSVDGELAGVSMDVHKQVGCGCCDGWAAYMRERGATVTIREDAELSDYRQGLGVPAEAAGCHTAVVDGFVVEGHVPAPAIVRLLQEYPGVVGVAVPGMPSVAPGMGGDEATWNAMDVYLIDIGGELDSFDF